jgi:hypothetical protein
LSWEDAPTRCPKYADESTITDATSVVKGYA